MNQETVTSYALVAFFVFAGIGGLLSAQQSLQYTGVGPAIANAVGSLLIFALAAGFVWLSR